MNEWVNWISCPVWFCSLLHVISRYYEPFIYIYHPYQRNIYCTYKAKCRQMYHAWIAGSSYCTFPQSQIFRTPKVHVWTSRHVQETWTSEIRLNYITMLGIKWNFTSHKILQDFAVAVWCAAQLVHQVRHLWGTKAIPWHGIAVSHHVMTQCWPSAHVATSSLQSEQASSAFTQCSPLHFVCSVNQGLNHSQHPSTSRVRCNGGIPVGRYETARHVWRWRQVLLCQSGLAVHFSQAKEEACNSATCWVNMMRWWLHRGGRF